ncbi:ABC transporter substrate-binding protein [Brevibacillus sp. SYSU BS000544]|uniref:ABC transporter substrate-binding protein n=1 Tax=Brevibacillus sp. SYSU BS000544 TaxID=3416443 RepID=UPI003CE4EFFB
MFKKFKVMNVLVSMSILLAGALAGCSTPSAAPTKAPEATQAPATVPAQEAAKEVQKLANVTIQAPMGISIAAPIYQVVDENQMTDFTEKITFKPWKTPDELRARISGGQAEVSAVPTYVGANLYNKGMDVKLINTLIWGNLYVIGPDGEKVTWESLKGKTIHVPFKGDMPDLVFRYLLKKSNVDPSKDVKIEYVSAPQELMQLLIAGKATYAVLPEHVASLSVIKGNKEGKKLAKVMNLQNEWAKATGKEARIPQAGILVSGELIKKNPEFVEALQKQIEKSVEYLTTQPAEASTMVAKYQEGMDAKVIEKLIPSLGLKFVRAKDAKQELEFFFTELSTISPEIIGGKLPDEGFYYQK